MSWSHWLRSRQAQPIRTSARSKSRKRSPLVVELLEERVVPVVSVSMTDPTMLSDTAAGNVTRAASVSQNGRYVVYTDTAANLSPGQAMNSKTAEDVFLYDRSTGATTLVSHAAGSSTTTADGTAINAAISADGNWIAYVSNSDNLVSGETLSNDSYTLTLAGYTGGTFTVAYNGQSSIGIPYNASLTTIQNDVGAIPGVGGIANVAVSGGLPGAVTIAFVGALGHGAAADLTFSGSGLSGSNGVSSFQGGHNEFLCDQYWVFLYNVATGTTTLVSHAAPDQGTGYATMTAEGNSGYLNGDNQMRALSVASEAQSVSISAHGEFITYVSESNHLVNGEQVGTENPLFPPGPRANAFVYDRVADTNILLSYSAQSGAFTNSEGYAEAATISADGSTIAFVAQAGDMFLNEFPNNDGGSFGPDAFEEVYVAKQGASGSWGNAASGSNATISLVSHRNNTVIHEASAATPYGNLDVLPAPAVTPDGKWIAYTSFHDDIIFPVASGGYGVQIDNVYLYNADPNDATNYQQNFLVSHLTGNAYQAANNSSTLDTEFSLPYMTPAVSDDGRFVTFASSATNLTSTASTAGENVFLFDRLAADPNNNVTRITHASIPAASIPLYAGNGGSFASNPLAPTISGNGRYVGYVALATADVSGVTNVNNLPGTKGLDALLYDQGPNPGVSTPTYTLLSHATASSTTTGTAEAYAPVFSDDGSTVLYLDDSNNLLPAMVNGHTGQDLNAALPTDGTDLYAYSVAPPSGYTPLAANGTNATVTLRDPNLPTLNGNGESEISPVHAVSADGRYVVFTSNAPNLVAGEVDNSLTQNVYLYDANAPSGTNPVKLLSHVAGSTTTTGNGESANPVISADGSTVLFYSFATNLLAGETFAGTAGSDAELYLYNVVTGTLSLVSHTPGNDLQAANGTAPGSPTGTSGYSSLLYSTSTAQGLALPSVSDNGQYIAYLSNANDLTGAGGTALNGTITAVSDPLFGAVKITTASTAGLTTGMTVTIANAGGVPDIDGSWTITVNNGTQFTLSGAIGLGETYTSGGTWTVGAAATTNAFLYDRTQDTTTLVSQLGTTAANGNADTVAISGDGTTVAFTDKATNLLATAITTSSDQLYVWSRTANGTTGLSAGQIRLASHALSGTTTAASFGASSGSSLWGPLPASLSTNGAFVAYYFGGSNLVTSTADPNAAADNVFRYDVFNNVNLLVSHTSGSTTTAGDNPVNANQYEASGPAISANGQFVAYANNSTNITGVTGQNGKDNVYLYNASTQLNTLVSHAAGSTTLPDTNGGTSPAISPDGRYVSFIDLALDTTADVQCTFVGPAITRLYDSTAGSAQPTAMGGAFEPSTMLIIGASLAPTDVVVGANGPIVAWDGLSSITAPVPGDRNGNLDVFLQAPTGVPVAPTSINLTLAGPPPLSTSSTMGTIVGIISAAPAGQTYTYTLTGTSNNNNLFTLNASTGVLTTMSTFSVTTPTNYTITVMAANTANTSLSLTQNFTITVYPGITGIGLTAATPPVTSASATGTPVGTLTATDLNTGQTLTFTLTGPNANLFTITGGNVLKTATGLTAGTIPVGITATDTLGLTTTQTINVMVYQPLTNLSLATGTPLTTASATGTPVGTLTVTDLNSGQTDTFMLTGPNANLFNLTGGNTLTTAATLTAGAIPVGVTATDTLGLTLTQNVTVNVYQPITTITLTAATPPVLTISAVGTTAGTLTANDLNSGQTDTFTLTGPNANLFHITGNTLTTAVSNLTAGTILVGITVTDTAGLTYTQNVMVTVVAPPQITTLSTTFTANVLGTFPILANGTTPITFTAGTGVNAPPAWLTLSPTGVLSGTPPVGTNTMFTFQVTATNSGASDPETFTLTVVAPPHITTLSTTFTAGQLNSYSLSASGTTPITYTAGSSAPPAWLMLSSSGTLSGTPPTGGIFTFDVTATNSVGSDPETFTLTVNQAPAITTLSTTFAVGASNTFTLSAIGFPTPSFTSTNLPSGLNLTTGGVLTGTPTTGGGVYHFNVTAANGTGTDPETFTLTVNQAPAITTLSTTFVVGASNTFTLSATGFPVPTFTSSNLPAGLNLTTGGVLTGTPTAGSGVYPFNVTATNGTGSNAATFTLTVNQAPALTTTSTTFVVGASNSFTLSATGFPVPTFTSSNLPAGLNLTTGGVLTGTPTAGGGVYHFNVTATNGTGSDPETFTLTVNQAPAITTTSTTFVVGASNSFTLSATGFPAPTFTSSNLPAGLNLTTGGVLTGTPTAAGNVYTFNVTATNSVGSDPKTFTLTVNQAPALTTTSTTFVVGASNSFTLSATGFPAPSFTSTNLPAGLNLSTGGVLTGTPTAGSGGYAFNITASNSVGSDPETFTLTVNQAPAITTLSTTFVVGASNSFTLSATGFPAPTFTSSNLPAGLNLSTGGVLTGTPTAGGNVYTFNVTATNSVGSDPKTFTLTVNQAPALTTTSTTFVVGASNSFTLSATGFPTPTFTSSNLPAGLNLTTGGVLTGTPTAGGGGYSFSVTAANSVSSDTETFTLTVDQAPVITTLSTTFTAGRSNSFDLSATGTTPITYAASTGVNWLTLSSTGTLSGTPPAGTTGEFDFQVTATNSAGFDTKTFTLTVVSAPVLTTLGTTFTAGQMSTFDLSASGTTPITYTADTGANAPPVWLTLASDGTLSGMPPLGTSGTFPFQVTASNSVGDDVETFALTVAPPLQITTLSTAFTAGQPSTFQLQASGAGPVTYTAGTGADAPPVWLTVSSTGLLSGTAPLGTTGMFSFLVTATNGAGDDTETFNLSVTAPTISPAIGTSSTVSLPVGSAAGTTFQVSITDGLGQPISGVPVTYTVVGSGPAGGNFATGSGPASTVQVSTDSSGLATPTFTANTAAGTYTVTATIPGFADPITFDVTNLPGTPATITALSGTPQSVTVTGDFGTLEALVEDSHGNPEPGVTVVFAAPSSGASGTFASSATVTTDSDGIATAPTFTANTTAGSYSVTASVSGVTSPASFDLTNTAGTAASASTVSGTTQTFTVNNTVINPFQVTVVDSHGNPVSGASVTYTVTLGGSGATGAFGGSTTVTTDSSGIATASNFTPSTKAGTYTVTATIPGVATPVTFEVTNNPAGPAAITVESGSGQSVGIAQNFAPLQALVTDPYGNPVEAGFLVTFTAPSTGAGGTFTGSSAVATDAGGIATAPLFTANTTASSFSVTAAVAGVATPATFQLTITAGIAATVSAVSGTTSQLTVNTAVTAPFEVTVVDAHGNPVPGISITYVVQSGGHGAGGAFAGSTTVTTNATGVASAPTFTPNTVAGTYTVTATATGIPGALTFSVTNLPGAPAAISALSGSGQSAAVTTAFAPLEALVTDQYGNPEGAGVSVTFAAPPGGTFSGTPVVATDANGIATAPTFVAGMQAGAETVTATITGTSLPSAEFPLTTLPGAAALLTALAGDGQSTPAGTAFATPLEVAVTDAFGNPVGAGIVVTFTTPSTGAAASFAGATSIQVTTDANGLATASALTANSQTGSYSITVTAGSGSTSFTLTNAPGIPPASTAVVYVDPAWASLTAGSNPINGNPSIVLGVNAFATIPEANSAVAAAGTIVLDAGTYSGAVGVSRAGTVQLNGDVTLTPGTDAVVFDSAVTAATPGGASLTVQSGGGDVVFNAAVGTVPLANLSVTGAGNVVFGGALNLAGQLTETAAANAIFNGGSVGGSVDVTATNVMLDAGKLTVGSDATLTASDFLDLAAGTTLQASGNVVLNVGNNNVLGGSAHVDGTIDAASAAVQGGPGNDILEISKTGDVPLSVDGGGGSDTLTVDLSGVSAAQSVTVTAGKITSSALPSPVLYTASDGGFAGGITIDTGAGNDAVLIESVPAGDPTHVNTGAGNDTFTVSSSPNLATSTLAGLKSRLFLDAGAGSNTLNVSEAGLQTPDKMFITATSIASTAIPNGIIYQATGGNYGGGINIVGAAGDTTFVVLSAATGVPTTVYGQAGNDTFNVAVTPASDYTNLTLNGEGGANTVGVYDQAGTGVVQTSPAAGAATVSVSYLNSNSIIKAQNIVLAGNSTDPNTNFIQALYHTELGFDAGPSDLNYWLGVLQAQGRAAVVTGIDLSNAALTRVVSGWYTQYLGRAPEGGEEQVYVGRIMSGETEEVVLADLLASSLDPDPATYIGQLFTKLLGFSPSADDLNVYVNTLLPQVGRNGVAWLVLTSAEYRGPAIVQDYSSLLGWSLDPATLQALVASGTDLLTLREQIEESLNFGTVTTSPAPV